MWKHVVAAAMLVATLVCGAGGAVAGPGSDATLKIALLPVFDVLPFFVAESRGLFETQQIRVVALTAGSSLEQSQLMMAEAIDGMLADLIVVAAFNREAVRVKAVASACRPAAGHPMFRVLSAPGLGDLSARLVGLQVGVSHNTIIEYVTDRLLRAAGFEEGRIVKQSVPSIPERYQLLLQGRLQGATLPEPLAASAMAAGASSLVDDAAHPSFSVSVLVFSRQALAAKGEAVRRFLEAWSRAAAAINASPGAYRPLVREKIRIPPNLAETFTIGPYPVAEVPSAAQWDDVIAWMLSKQMLERPLAYRDAVEPGLLPREPPLSETHRR
jgi:NitT/TauT family transport system substrate-binding protein